MQEYPEALSHYKLALAAQPYNAQFWYWLGYHYQESGMADEAKQAYLQAKRYSHRGEGSAEAVKQLGALPGKDGASPPAPEEAPVTDPSTPQPQTEKPATMP
jgi:tetratricopeptide (TPR) repeat protein